MALADALHALASPMAIIGARADRTMLASPALVAVAVRALAAVAVRAPAAVPALVAAPVRSDGWQR